MNLRFAQHLASVRLTNENQKPTATGEHFYLSGHSINNMKVSILEKVTQDSIAYIKVHESFYIIYIIKGGVKLLHIFDENGILWLNCLNIVRF